MDSLPYSLPSVSYSLENALPTIKFYDRAYKKLALVTEDGTQPISTITQTGFQKMFVESLGNVNQQTINAYLRGFRSFGNYCAWYKAARADLQGDCVC